MFCFPSLHFIVKSVIDASLQRSLTGFAGLIAEDPSKTDPITEESDDVTSFGLWWQ